MARRARVARRPFGTRPAALSVARAARLQSAGARLRAALGPISGGGRQLRYENALAAPSSGLSPPARPPGPRLLRPRLRAGRGGDRPSVRSAARRHAARVLDRGERTV